MVIVREWSKRAVCETVLHGFYHGYPFGRTPSIAPIAVVSKCVTSLVRQLRLFGSNPKTRLAVFSAKICLC